MYVSLILPSVRGATSTRTLINGSTKWGGDMLLYEVINGWWFGKDSRVITSDYIYV